MPSYTMFNETCETMKKGLELVQLKQRPAFLRAGQKSYSIAVTSC